MVPIEMLVPFLQIRGHKDHITMRNAYVYVAIRGPIKFTLFWEQ